MASFSTTLIALAAPRRSLPIAGVVAALVAVQLWYGPARASLVPLGMSLAFVVLAPWSWRRLLAQRTSAGHLALYAGAGVLAVATFGVALPRALGLEASFLTDEGSLAISLVLYLVGGWGLGRDIELEQGLEHTRLQALRTHLDPHFLYNTLNAIAEWCREAPAVAEEATLRLADLLRAILEALETRRWPLRRELALVRALLELHRIRDEAAFTAAIDVEQGAEDREIAPLVVVSLVENALKHGPRSGHRGEIDVRISTRGAKLFCEVENPGPFAPRSSHTGGLHTLRSRLAFAYGRDAAFAIAAASPQRTRATLELGQVRT